MQHGKIQREGQVWNVGMVGDTNLAYMTADASRDCTGLNHNRELQMWLPSPQRVTKQSDFQVERGWEAFNAQRDIQP